jgi:hypothetical protein
MRADLSDLDYVDRGVKFFINAEETNEWSYTFTPPICFYGVTGSTLRF